jgi:hypothetical protein
MEVWMRATFRAAVAPLALSIAFGSARAQTRSTWSIQASGLVAGLGGAAYSGIDPGGGFEVQARRKLTPTTSLGCGFQGTYHTFTKFQGNVKLQGAFCEPRQILDVGSESIFPYISARGSVLQRNDTDPTGFNATAMGLTGNGGAGVMIPFGSATSSHPTLLELGASLGYTWFGNISWTDPTGRSITHPTGGGWNFVTRVGLAIGL